MRDLRQAVASVLGILLCVWAGAADAEAPDPVFPLLDRELVIVQKTSPGDSSPPRTLPPAVQARFGPDFVDYEAFVAIRLPAAEARTLREAVIREGWDGLFDAPQPVALPFHSFRPERPQEREGNWTGRRLRPEPVPGLFLARFAFPLKAEWAAELAQCGAQQLVYFGHGTFLVRAPSLGAVRSCGVARYLDWAGPYLTTDRMAPDLLDATEPKSYWLQFLPGTDRLTALAEIPAGMEVLDDYLPGGEEPARSKLSLLVQATSSDLEELLRSSHHLLVVLPVAAGGPSDERQGQILAGLHDGTKVLPLGPSAQHYTA